MDERSRFPLNGTNIAEAKIKEFPTMLARLIRDDQGQDLIEYVLLGSFIALVALAGATALGTQLNGWYDKVATWVGNQAAAVPTGS
jgi:Flp pilus assembly pilin Flp